MEDVFVTKRASGRMKLNIFLVAVKVALCFCLLIFGTYALFTDEDELNVFVTTADLDMELLTVDLEGNETDISGRGADVFKSDHWEPGQTRAVFLKVRSRSNVRVKYTLNLISSSAQLDGAIEYCSFLSQPFDVRGMTWESISAARDIQYLSEGHNSLSGDNYVTIEPNEEHCYALLVHMREDAADYQDRMTDIEIYLYATQGNADTN